MKHVVNGPYLVKCELRQRGDLICLIICLVRVVGGDDEGDRVLCDPIERREVARGVRDQKGRGVVHLNDGTYGNGSHVPNPPWRPKSIGPRRQSNFGVTWGPTEEGGPNYQGCT
jgi:hypothetical protein